MQTQLFKIDTDGTFPLFSLFTAFVLPTAFIKNDGLSKFDNLPHTQRQIGEREK